MRLQRGRRSSVDGRYPALAVALLGLASAFSGVSGLAGVAAVGVFCAVVFLSPLHSWQWYSHLAAGSLVAVAAGLSSLLWTAAIMLVLLAWVEVDLGLLKTPKDRRAYVLFTVAALLFIPMAGLRHVPLPLALLLAAALAGVGVLAVLWYRLVWTSQKGEP
jgi:hypothetical protein